MPHRTGRFSWATRLAHFATVCTLVLLAMVIIATVAWSVTIALSLDEWAGRFDVSEWAMIALCVLAIVAELVCAVWVLIAYGLVRVIVANESAVHASSGRLQRIETIAADQAKSAKKLIELASLSDQAKSLIFREQERETLRETIHADIIRQDYTEAESLIDSIESRYGYAMEASRLREELEASRRATLDEKIDTAIARINDIIERDDWTRANREAHRLMKMFPNHPKTVGLVKRVEDAHSHRKRSLLEAYRDAVDKKDVERGVELLEELDRYLSPPEAAALEESARGVFRAKLHNLGVQFAISVTDLQWDEAIATGMEIVKGFPNSRMAHEVAEKMDLLHTKAAEQKNPATADSPSS